MNNLNIKYLNLVNRTTAEEVEYNYKINNSRKFAKSYCKMMSILFVAIVIKRFLFEP